MENRPQADCAGLETITQGLLCGSTSPPTLSSQPRKALLGIPVSLAQPRPGKGSTQERESKALLCSGGGVQDIFSRDFACVGRRQSWRWTPRHGSPLPFAFFSTPGTHSRHSGITGGRHSGRQAIRWNLQPGALMGVQVAVTPWYCALAKVGRDSKRAKVTDIWGPLAEG